MACAFEVRGVDVLGLGLDGATGRRACAVPGRSVKRSAAPTDACWCAYVELRHEELRHEALHVDAPTQVPEVRHVPDVPHVEKPDVPVAADGRRRPDGSGVYGVGAPRRSAATALADPCGRPSAAERYAARWKSLTAYGSPLLPSARNTTE